MNYWRRCAFRRREKPEIIVGHVIHTHWNRALLRPKEKYRKVSIVCCTSFCSSSCAYVFTNKRQYAELMRAHFSQRLIISYSYYDFHALSLHLLQFMASTKSIFRINFYVLCIIYLFIITSAGCRQTRTRKWMKTDEMKRAPRGSWKTQMKFYIFSNCCVNSIRCRAIVRTKKSSMNEHTVCKYSFPIQTKRCAHHGMNLALDNCCLIMHSQINMY